jgi:hypothetical protein
MTTWYFEETFVRAIFASPRNPIWLIDASIVRRPHQFDKTTSLRNDRASCRFSHPHMPSDPINPIRAAVLSATLSFEPRPADLLDLGVPPIRFVMPHTTPLDLDAAYFRYRIGGDGLVHSLPQIAGARVCREKSPRRRRRSASRS